MLAAGDRALPNDPIQPSFTHISKMFAPLGRKTVIWHVVKNALRTVEQVTLIIKPKFEKHFRNFLPSKDFDQKVQFAFQPKARGSADALRHAYKQKRIPLADQILILMGYQPLFPSQYFNALFNQNIVQKTLATVSTMKIPKDDPDFEKCGVVEFDELGNFQRIVKTSQVAKAPIL
ncbi:MAG: hypothetical protein COT26_01235 [Candidatus Kerfeldbacteria bacterium CG08_land_8_20_14_0_20_43_14]|uniref:Nucleotidyl transferase domain-containing protein n=1 Tax=Candidatus Kerfeldbacteria bacterium CG08_land_8_20_14_0_20_43_14 TaxID=2014246 RepID=A0A2H0YQT3_9BACT|nr:MAG: hypothetical protein COT26_01235 [Candidatus Kerfeldbacteria bacterium CG08_land_8_20_14_0_20_43_14]